MDRDDSLQSSSTRKLDVLQLPAPEVRRFNLLSEDDEVNEKAWVTEYLGDSHHLLQQAINAMKSRENAPYSNFVSIVQSSGMGKSRMVDELAKSVFTLPFNLRSWDEISGYPHADDGVREFLRIQGVESEQETHSQLRYRYVIFLTKLFTNVKEKVQNLAIHDSAHGLAAEWRSCLQDRTFRMQLYDGIVIQEYTKYPKQDGYDRQAGYKAEDAAWADMKQSAEDLLSAIAGHVREKSHDAVQIAIYFDDSHDLMQDRTNHVLRQDRMIVYTAYRTLCEAFSILWEYPIFVLYLSTNLDLSIPGPSGRSSSSTQVYCLNAPFVELPFDVAVTATNIEADTLSVDEVCKDGFMVRFGRPLFWARYENGSDVVKENILSFAIMKLTGEDPTKLAPNEMASLASLGIRLLLEFEPGYYAAEVVCELVANHMHVAYSVPWHREYMHAGTPSEPILAEAAAIVMTRIGVLDVLQKFLRQGHISRGESGELVARLLFTLAHDRAAVALSGPQTWLPWNREEPDLFKVRYSRAIPIIDFLRELVGEKNLDAILLSQPDNIPSKISFQQAFKHSRVHFTQFAKAGDESAVTDNAAWRAMCRGIVFQCFKLQQQIDIVIPIIMHETKKLGCYSMSALLVQIRDTKRHEAAHIDADTLDFFSHSTSQEVNERPYITLVMEFDAQSRQPSRDSEATTKGKSMKGKISTADNGLVAQKTISDLSPSVPGAHTSGDFPQPHPPLRSTHPRYSIRIRGCSHAIYAVIGPDEKDTYASMLGSRSLLEELPREDTAHLRRLEPTSPGWSYEWVPAIHYKNDPTTQRASIPKLNEGISVGKFSLDQDSDVEMEMEEEIQEESDNAPVA